MRRLLQGLFVVARDVTGQDRNRRSRRRSGSGRQLL